MHKFMITTAAVLALASAGTLFAQPADGSNQTASMHSMKKMHDMNKMHAQGEQQRLAKLKSWLKITSSQESAWSGFAQAMQAMHPTRKSDMKPDAAKLIGAKAFEHMAMRAEQRAQKAQTLAKAADQLYAQLSTKQKAAWNMAMGKMLGKKHHRMMRKHTMHKMHQMKQMHGTSGGHS